MNDARLRRIRRELHALAEPAYLEHNTRSYIIRTLKSLGIETHEIFGCVVGVLHPGFCSGSRTIGMRAELDGLPIRERTTLPYASTTGNMHACGHDGHMAILLGVAMHFSSNPEELKIPVNLLFTPAEEEGAGCQHLISNGLLEAFPMDEIYALHNWPSLPLGEMACHEGTVMAGDSDFEILIEGKGGHAAMPDLCENPIDKLPGILSHIVSLRNENIIISPTVVESGRAINVIPEVARIRGTIRYLRDQDKRAVTDGLQRIAAKGTKVVINDAYPPTINSCELIDRSRRAIRRIGCRLVTKPASMATEDFSYLLQKVPGTYVWLGTGDASHTNSLHNPSYDFNDAALQLGVAYFIELASGDLS